MRTGSRWAAGLFGSALLHGAAALLWLVYAPDPPPTQPKGQSKLQLDTVTAPSQTARAQDATGDDAPEAEADSTALGAGAIPQSDASALPAPANRAEALTASGEKAQAAAPDAARPSAVPPDSTSLAAAAPQPQSASAATPRPASLAAAKPTSQMLDSQPAPLSPAPAVAAPAETANAAAPQGTEARQPPLPATSARAALAWQFGDRLVTDPQALSTIQAFMAPDALENAAANAGQVRDGLASVLAGVKCARLSATFLPETGTLELRGHIPDPALQGPILDTLRAQVGEGIPVTGNLLHLPEPQCGALTGIASVGLPQSTDQFTNARLVGETSHARAFSYTEGQRLQFDLTAPDYDAFVYVDYFNAQGEVIHLVPNQSIPLREHAAKSVVGVGHDEPGQPGLKILIGPPYGQEIAVAFAASQPLYDGLRPITEPAGAYLDFLRGRIARAREGNPGFKGEWVYFFITTSAATQ